MDKCYIAILKQLNINEFTPINSINIAELNGIDINTLLIYLSKNGYVILGKSSVSLSDKGSIYLFENRLQQKIPNQNIPTEYKEKSTPLISNIFKNDYVKFTIIGIISFIITYFMYEYFKYSKW